MRFTGIAEVNRNMDAFGKAVFDQLGDASAKAVAQAEADAKRSAPWIDRTGNARNSITGSGPQISTDRITSTLAIGVFYGKYLELSNGGKYRVIWPSIENVGFNLGKFI